MKLGIVAGEASGDLLGAGLIKALQKKESNLIATGVGGPAMIQAGFKTQHDIERLSVMGLIEPLLHLPDLFKMRRQLVQYFSENKPDVFVGIDAPDFNLGLEILLRKANIPIVHYVSPSVWAWRSGRIHKIAKAVDLMLTLFPFEADFYHRHHVPVQFVGHPLADAIPMQPDKMAARLALKLDENKQYIALLPGSRANEIKYLAEIFAKTAKHCLQENSSIGFISSAANEKRDTEFKQIMQQYAPDVPVDYFIGKSHDVMAAADVVLVSSGTATLETMLFKRPMVIAYRMAALTFAIGRRVVKVPYVGLPNLLAQERLVPEFLQEAATPENLSKALLDYLNHPEKVDALIEKFTIIHQQLRCDASAQAAAAIEKLITK